MLTLYIITYQFGNAINGSINQQKVLRGYFYSLLHGDSSVPSLPVIESIQRSGENVRISGMLAIGWRERASGNADNQNPISTCYRTLQLSRDALSSPTGPDETCDTKSQFDADGIKTKYIRVKTVYGICGDTFFINESSEVIKANHYPGLSFFSANFSACLNTI